jgi:hypothetical protein
MANGAYYVALDIELNLTEGDLGHPEYPGLWDLLRSDKRPIPERQLQCIQCRHARPDCPEWMYLNERNGIRFATHWNPSIADHPSNESDQHKAFKERIAVAAELGGHVAALEDRSESGRRRTDVLVTGADGLAIGWEVQLSYASVESVRKRAQTARGDGITPMWATVDGTREFINKVPWALMPDMPWKRIADSRDLLVRGGVRELDMRLCDWGNPETCPVKGRGRCGQRHAKWASALGIQLDELVRGSAAGEFAPIIVPGKRITNRWWVRTTDRDRWAESVGALLSEDDVQSRRAAPTARPMSPQPLETECTYGQDSGYRSAPASSQDGGDFIVTTAAPVKPPATTCCGEHHPGIAGESLKVACALCPNSPTYWRRSA